MGCRTPDEQWQARPQCWVRQRARRSRLPPGRVGAARGNPCSSRESPAYEGVGHRSRSRSRADSLVRRSQLGLSRRAGAGTQIRRRLIPRSLLGRMTPSSAGVSPACLEELVPELRFVVASSPGVCWAALDDPMPEPRFTTAVEVVCGRGALGLGVVTPRPLVVPLLANGAEAAVGVVWASSAPRTRCGFSEVADSAGAGRRCGASEIGRGCRTLSLSSRRFAIVRSGIDDIHHAYTRIARRVGATGIGLGSVHRHDDSRIPHELAAVPGRQIFRSRTTPQGASGASGPPGTPAGRRPPTRGGRPNHDEISWMVSPGKSSHDNCMIVG